MKRKLKTLSAAAEKEPVRLRPGSDPEVRRAVGMLGKRGWSLREISEWLDKRGHSVSFATVGRWLREG